MIDTIAYNKIYANTEEAINIYCPMNSFFDILVKSILNNIISINLEHKFIKYITFNKIIINDIFKNINFITTNTAIPYIIFLHENLENIKKEDLFIIKNKIQNNTIINFNPKNNKIFDNNIQYGIPKQKQKNKYTDEIKNILVLNKNNYLSDKYHIENFIDFSSVSSYNDIEHLLDGYDTVVCSHLIDHMIVQSYGIKTIDISNFNDLLSSNTVNMTRMNINYDFSSFSNKITKLSNLK
jgi:hypothetical protein